MSYYISTNGSILTDINVHLSDFNYNILYQCENCRRKLEATRICSHCHYKNNNRNLLLSAYYRGKHIWAYNEQHLDYLEAFITADIRIQRNRFLWNPAFSTEHSSVRLLDSRDLYSQLCLMSIRKRGAAMIC